MPVSLDWFADTDTEQSSAICCRVAGAGGFDADSVLQLAERHAPMGPNTALVYGGGFDSNPVLLDRLAAGRVLWGNAAETVREVKSPARFFALLDDLRIPYPESYLRRPAPERDSERWLSKRGASEGGTHVQWTALPTPGAADGETYVQRFVAGPACSALFLANGVDAEIIGFNRLWTSAHDPDHPFRFAGARTWVRPGKRLCEDLGGHVLALTRALSLRGINSLDFIVEDQRRISVLEVNPRPSATMALYDADYAGGLLQRHITACRIGVLDTDSRVGAPRAFKILYAEQAGVIPAGFNWPAWCSDRPGGGAEIAAGHPVCSIQAEHPEPDALEHLLFVREQALRQALML